MSELKAYTAQEIARNEKDIDYMDELFGGVKMPPTQVYLKSEADKVIADLEESHKNEVRQLLIENVKLKNRIAPKQSDKTLQERLNEVCEKHGVSTLQDLDWAFCESEKRRTRDCTEAAEEISHHKYKRCLAMAEWCESEEKRLEAISPIFDADKECWEYNSDYWARWHERWLELAEKFKEGVQCRG